VLSWTHGFTPLRVAEKMKYSYAVAVFTLENCLRPSFANMLMQLFYDPPLTLWHEAIANPNISLD
jgi:hypothetical protein